MKLLSITIACLFLSSYCLQAMESNTITRASFTDVGKESAIAYLSQPSWTESDYCCSQAEKQLVAHFRLDSTDQDTDKIRSFKRTYELVNALYKKLTNDQKQQQNVNIVIGSLMEQFFDIENSKVVDDKFINHTTSCSVVCAEMDTINNSHSYQQQATRRYRVAALLAGYLSQQ